MTLPVARPNSALPQRLKAKTSTPATARSLNWSGRFACLLMVSLLHGASAQAQIVNDPSTTILMNTGSQFKPVDTRALEEQSKKTEQGKAGQAAGQQKAPSDKATPATAPLPTENATAVKPKPIPATLQPTLEATSPSTEGATATSASTASGAEPIQARAVMVDINSNTLNYDKDRDVYVATGAVHMIISEQNSELFADKLTFDQNQDLAIAEGKVVIIKNGQRTEGTYAKIDLTRKSALINDTSTTLSAVRIKAKQSFVNANEMQLENGRMIISGLMYQQLVANGGMSNLSQGAGKGSQQARLRREYSKRVMKSSAMRSQMSLTQQETLQKFQDFSATKPDFDESPDKVSRFNFKAKEIDIVRHEDGYDDINLKHASMYLGQHKLFNFPDTDYSYDQTNKSIQYLGPDIGGYKAYGGAYAGPGWDMHLGRGSLRVSPVASFGSPGFWSSNGQTGRQIKNGLGFGGVAHYRDSDTAVDLAYNSHVGSPIFFADRRIFNSNTHIMASYNDVYQNGLLGQSEHPNYIAQLSDYRVLKDFKNFQLSSFESAGMARDNFYPNFRESYFVAAKNTTPQTLGRAQLQLQLQNTQPLLQLGKYASFGLRAQLLSAAYTSSNFIALGRIGPTLTLNLLGNRLQTSMAYTLSHSIGKSPFVFDSYYGGAQNVSINNMIRINKYLSLCNSGSYSLNRDNARKALTVGNLIYMMVGPQDFKASIGYDFINARSYFGLNFYPGPSNTIVNYDKMRITQPASYNTPTAVSKF
jgi:hypothetical protein